MKNLINISLMGYVVLETQPLSSQYYHETLKVVSATFLLVCSLLCMSKREHF